MKNILTAFFATALFVLAGCSASNQAPGEFIGGGELAPLSGAQNKYVLTGDGGNVVVGSSAGGGEFRVLYNGAERLSADSSGLSIADLVATNLRVDTNNTPIQMLDESGNYHDVLSVDTGGNTTLSAPSGELIRLFNDSTETLRLSGGVLRGQLGSAASPAYGNLVIGDTGVYFPSSTSIGLSAGGSNVATFDSGGLVVIDGSAASPSIHGSDPDTGFSWEPAAGRTNVNANGTRRFFVDTSGAQVTGELLVTGISSDGSGKVACVKADGAIGSCSSTVAAGGTCTCG